MRGSARPTGDNLGRSLAGRDCEFAFPSRRTAAFAAMGEFRRRFSPPVFAIIAAMGEIRFHSSPWAFAIVAARSESGCAFSPKAYDLLRVCRARRFRLLAFTRHANSIRLRMFMACGDSRGAVQASQGERARWKLHVVAAFRGTTVRSRLGSRPSCRCPSSFAFGCESGTRTSAARSSRSMRATSTRPTGTLTIPTARRRRAISAASSTLGRRGSPRSASTTTRRAPTPPRSAGSSRPTPRATTRAPTSTSTPATILSTGRTRRGYATRARPASRTGSSASTSPRRQPARKPSRDRSESSPARPRSAPVCSLPSRHLRSFRGSTRMPRTSRPEPPWSARPSRLGRALERSPEWQPPKSHQLKESL